MNITCERCQGLLDDLLDGSISPHEEKKAREHLDECPNCVKELCNLKEVIEILKTYPHVEPSSNFTECVLKRLPIRESLVVERWNRFSVLEVLGCLCILLVVTLLCLQFLKTGQVFLRETINLLFLEIIGTITFYYPVFSNMSKIPDIYKAFEMFTDIACYVFLGLALSYIIIEYAITGFDASKNVKTKE